jgi:hypothetical protein
MTVSPTHDGATTNIFIGVQPLSNASAKFGLLPVA